MAHTAETLDEIDERIAVARLDGRDAELARLRRRREEVERDAREAAGADRLKAERDARAAEERRRGELASARRDAAAAAERFNASAERIDGALAALEEATRSFRLASVDLSTTLRRAGLSDDGRIARQTPAAARWAVWRSAPSFAEMALVPRVPMPRRRLFAESAPRLAPRIEE